MNLQNTILVNIEILCAFINNESFINEGVTFCLYPTTMLLEYEENRRKRLGDDAPHRLRYKKLMK